MTSAKPPSPSTVQALSNLFCWDRTRLMLTTLTLACGGAVAGLQRAKCRASTPPKTEVQYM